MDFERQRPTEISDRKSLPIQVSQAMNCFQPERFPATYKPIPATDYQLSIINSQFSVKSQCRLSEGLQQTLHSRNPSKYWCSARKVKRCRVFRYFVITDSRHQIVTPSSSPCTNPIPCLVPCRGNNRYPPIPRPFPSLQQTKSPAISQ